ncbi:MAG TPA: CmpA/NrtA family ABC transporter substrate-binding protein [Caulobacteraceae bacterium]|nr:CmpA/NrtA family ABC transporter substrate-binding protein [Caulobacteraceae bacterium]
MKLGFIPLNDCAPLAVAEAKGFFAAEGLEVTLSREASWATVRDKVAVGALNGAHMLAPMILAASLGVGGEPTRLVTPMALNLNGSAITVSKALAQALRRLDPDGVAARTARPLARLIAARRELGSAPLTFAVVFAYSMHSYELRYWLAESGVDPDADVRLVVVPPPRMADQLRAGLIDGFCVGGPWGALASADGAGETLAYAADIWNDSPDKALGVNAAWAEANPEVLQALLRGLLRAADWCDRQGNRAELAAILATEAYVGAPADLVARSLEETEIVFHRRDASFPWVSHAAWFLSQMRRWGQLDPAVDIAAAAARVYRPDLFRTAAAAVGMDAPDRDGKLEQGFGDGRVFDLAAAADYAAGFKITRS